MTCIPPPLRTLADWLVPAERSPRPRRWISASLLTWVALNIPALLLVQSMDAVEHRPLQLLVGAAVIGAAVLIYFRLPLVSFVLCLGLWWFVGIMQNDVGSIVVSPYLPAVFISSFTVGRLPMRPASVLASVGAVILAGTAVTAFAGLTLPMWFVLVTSLIFACQLPWLVGRYARQRSELQHAGWEHARQLELQQRISVEQARLRERTRIAEDMHDSLGHELSLIALRAGALQVTPGVDERFRDAAGELRANAASSLERLRDIIGVLREDDAPARMEPAQPNIGDLVERARDSGVDVAFDRSGDTGRLDDMTDKALFRVVQESLTNAMKHAPGSRIAVRLAYAVDEVTVTVRNGPSPQRPDRPAVQGRRGLIGLEERTRLAGGALRAAPLHDGGFEVQASLPRTPPAMRQTGSTTAPIEIRAEITEDSLAHATTRLRRRFISLVALPLSLCVCLAVGMLGYYAYLSSSSALAPKFYDRIELGSTTGQIQHLLPDNEMSDPPSESLPEPEGADCRYYRASSALFVRVDVYRLCFQNGDLTHKDVITAKSREPVDHD